MPGSIDLNLQQFAAKTYETLFQLAQDKTELRNQVLKIPLTSSLFGLCEHYDILDKIILEDGPIRIRLHIFADEYFDRPHNHRWTYSSLILSGGYQHTIYSLKEEIDSPEIQDVMPVRM